MKAKSWVASLAVAVAAFVAAGNPASAQLEGKTVRIGVLTDLSSVFSDGGGLGSVDAARMAIEDYGGKVAGAKIDVQIQAVDKTVDGKVLSLQALDDKGAVSDGTTSVAQWWCSTDAAATEFKFFPANCRQAAK